MCVLSPIRSDPPLRRRPRGTWEAGGTPPCDRRAWARGCTPSIARRTRRVCHPNEPAANGRFFLNWALGLTEVEPSALRIPSHLNV